MDKKPSSLQDKTAAEEDELRTRLLEVAANMVRQGRELAEFRAAARVREEERAALAAADAERINNAGKNLPRLKAVEMLKAGVLFVSENGEEPDPEKFGPKLLAYGSMHGTMDWYTVVFDHGRWSEPADGLNVYDIECWMLPPDLKT